MGIKCEEGNAYHTQQDFKRATEHHERVLKIAKEVGDKVREGCAYGNPSNAYQNLRDLKVAIDYHEPHLNNCQKSGRQN